MSTDAGSVTGERTTQEQSLLMRVRGEFEEMAGLRLTLAQAARLFGVSTDTCARLLSALIDEGVLGHSAGGQSQRRDAHGDACALTVAGGVMTVRVRVTPGRQRSLL